MHFHWVGAYDMNGATLPTTPDVARVYQRALLETDYSALSTRQRALEAAMRNTTVRVTTPAGTDLRFRIGDRPVTKQDGDASAARATRARNLIDREVELPAGAIRVAPLEESVEGTIAFPPALWSGVRVEGLVLTFARGRVTAVRATTGRDAVERELAAGGDAARGFREIALGLNPLLADSGRGTALDPLLWIWRWCHSTFAGRQLRARRHGARYVRAVEFLHGCDDDGRLGHVGPGWPLDE